MLWIKAFHIVFVASWFACLFYLPRMFVNLVQVPSDSHAERERLLLMARKLYRFGSLLMLPALALGLWLWLGYGFNGGWLYAKLALVIVAIGYHHACRSLLRGFEQVGRKTAFRALVSRLQRVGGAALHRDRAAGGGEAVLIAPRRSLPFAP